MMTIELRCGRIDGIDNDQPPACDLDCCDGAGQGISQ